MGETAKRAGRKRKTKKQSTNPMVYLLILLVFVGMIGGFYWVAAGYYHNRFPNHTTINGFDVSNMTVDNAKQLLSSQTQNYILTIHERDGEDEVITARQIGMEYDNQESVEALSAQFEPLYWVKYYFNEYELSLEINSTFDENKAKERINSLRCLDFRNYIKPENAKLVAQDGVFVIQPERQGKQPDEERVKNLILTALKEHREEIDLEEEDCYLAPSIVQDDKQLNEALVQVNEWTKAKVTYDFEDDRIEVADGAVIAKWVSQDEKGNYYLDRSKALEWVKTNLAYKYDTFGLTHQVKTHSGKIVTLKGGDYGWCIAREDTTDELMKAVKKGEVTTLEPAYQYKAKNRGKDDIGGTYVEVSIQEQMMWCYEDYELKVETPVVTGDTSRGDDTPSGSVWAMDCHKSPATLGTFVTMGYSSYVNYWMSFTGNVGIHDASWRGTDLSSYGGEIYKTNGSHGCVNTPYDAAKQIFKICNVGTPVIVY